MTIEGTIEIQVGGKLARVPVAFINKKTVITTGNWLKKSSIMDEEFQEGETLDDPEAFVSKLKDAGVKSDIFSFAQKVPDVTRKYNYHMEWDNAAVIPITSYSDWLENRVEQDVRKAIRRAKRLGVIVKLAEFNDAFVEGICGIYNESSVRQGTAFWHYQKNFDTVKRENSTYLERSAYIGAYFNDELIGFIRMVYVGNVAATLQVISQKRHFDKKPTNALIAKAVEICEMNKVSHLVYGNYVYNDMHNSLTEFKRRNGFEQILLPRYYIPFTLKGQIALKLRFHHPLVQLIPKPVLTQIRAIKTLWHKRNTQSLSNAT